MYNNRLSLSIQLDMTINNWEAEKVRKTDSNNYMLGFNKNTN
jgi:hypothetical protein